MKPTLSKELNRRSFLKLSTLASGGLALAYYLKSATSLEGQVSKLTESTDENSFKPSAFVHIAHDGTVTLASARPEIGQGIKTSLPMIIAEELGVKWTDVKVISVPLNPIFGGQAAGGSTSTPTSYMHLRRVGATARTLLIQAAAASWSVPVTECFVKDGSVVHKPTGKSLSYGALVQAAAKLPVPDEHSVVLKDPSEFTLLGSRIGGVDNQKVVTGQPLFGIDQVIPGMLYAVYVKCPVWGGKVVSANLDVVKSQPGVRDAFIINETVPYHNNPVLGLVPGVAILADSTWNAFSARKQLQVVWDEGKFANDSWSGYSEAAKQMATTGKGLKKVRDSGNVDQAFQTAAKVIEADYHFAFIGHTNLEPQNTTAHFTGNKIYLWSPTQNPGDVQASVAEALDIEPENVSIVMTRIGGGFGRRLHPDPCMEAAVIAKKCGQPIKLTWSREDDFQHDHFRPGGFHHFKAGLDAKGKLIAFADKVMGFDAASGADNYPARFIDNCRIEAGKIPNNVPTGPWRAPGSNTYGFVICSFLDELAHAGGRDPVEFSLEILGTKDVLPGTGPRSAPYNAARMRGVIKLAAEKAGWGKTLPKGQGMGLGYYFSHQGYVAEVAEVTVTKEGELKVTRVVAAVDVGSQIVNLSGAENQVQGAIIDGLNSSWRQELDIQNGRLVQSNFHEYQMLRMPDTIRDIEIHFSKTKYPPTGLGEPALPPLAPAVANAIFAATGKRIRQLPFSHTDLRWS